MSRLSLLELVVDMSVGRAITLFLIDGTPDGLRSYFKRWTDTHEDSEPVYTLK